MTPFSQQAFLDILRKWVVHSPLNTPGVFLSVPGVADFHRLPAEVHEAKEMPDFPCTAAWRVVNGKAGRKRGLRYAVGYASIRGIPVPREHAWAVTPTGVVYDPSWMGAGEHYFGAVIRPEFVKAHLSDSYAGLLTPPSPLLRHPVDQWLAQEVPILAAATGT